MPVKNVDLAYRTLDYIREHPEEWDQGSYACGTTACFGGRAVILAGGGGTSMIWRGDAADVLGWTEAEAEHVFYLSTRDFAELETAVKQVLNGEIEDDE